jgi:methylmalonyl-CoA/ethylmalonyl-CoA epimerase
VTALLPVPGATFHHLGVATDDMPGAIAVYRALGYEPGALTVDAADAVDIVFLFRADGPLVELVAPTSDASPVATWLRRRGAGVYHTCYEVPSLPAAIEQLRQAQWVPATACRPAPALGNRTIVFMFHPALGLMELVEREAAP